MSRKAPLVVGVIVIIALMAYVTLYRSSPGELSRPHAAVAGSSFINDCNKCHAEKDVTVGCLKCHLEIQGQLQDHKGFHSYLLKEKKLECAHCHSEHNGADFALVSSVSWGGKDPKTFTHPHVDFRLKGAHAALACEKCHAPKNRRPFTLPAFPKNRRPSTYLGLTQACMSCHVDPHAGGRASACAECHSQDQWKPAPLFNHEKYFSLQGAHARVSCKQCHAINRPVAASVGPAKIFGPVKGKRCADCHASPHRVDWHRSCETCHALRSAWSEANSTMTKEAHASTGFRLGSPHDHVSCQKCHAPSLPFKDRYPDPRRADTKRSENRCERCHGDPHRGQFKLAHSGCLECHSTTAFKPARFPIDRHSTYPLSGQHRTAACNACHLKDRATGQRLYGATPRDCASCHQDIHYGQFRRQGKTVCESCHRSSVKWPMLVFNHETQSRFPLGKAHQKVSCQACHPVVRLSPTARLRQYKPVKTECSDCHGFNVPSQ